MKSKYVIGVLIIAFIGGGIFYISNSNGFGFFAFWKELMAANEIKIEDLSCHGVLNDRRGSCTFTIDQSEFGHLIKRLSLREERGSYIKEGERIHDPRRNVKFDKLFYDPAARKARVELQYPYG